MTAVLPQDTKERGRRLPRRLLLGGLVLLVVGATWWWWPAAAAVPPMPADIKEEDVRELIEEARRDVLARPRSGPAWGRLGMVLLAHLFDRDADACFTEGARLDPHEPLWPYGRALVAQRRDPENALGLLRQAEARAEKGTETHAGIALRLAESLLERRELDEAEEVFAAVRGDAAERSARTDAARAAFGLGLVARARGRPREARELLRKAEVSAFARKAAAVQLAAVARADRDDAAADEYEKKAAALPGDPPWPDPLLDEVVMMQVGRRGRERRIGRLESEQRFAEAAEVYLEQIERGAEPRDYLGAGVNLARVRDYERALPLLREALNRDPDGAQTTYTLALVLFTRAEVELDRSPGSAEARSWLREAADRARRATALKSDHAHAFAVWGLALLALGEPAAAIAPLRVAAEQEPTHFQVRFGLGRALAASGMVREAETELEAARQLQPDDPRPGRELERLRRKGE